MYLAKNSELKAANSSKVISSFHDAEWQQLCPCPLMLASLTQE